MIALGWLSLNTGVAILGYWILPDNSPSANRQLTAAARQPPGSAVTLLVLPDTAGMSQGIWGIWWQGRLTQETCLPVQPQSLHWQDSVLHYVDYAGLPGTLSTHASLPAARERFLADHLRLHTFWLGSDVLGRDVLSRLMLGTRVSMGVGLLAVLVSLALGVTLGALSGYYGGRVDAAIQWLMSVVWSLPSLLLALVLAFALGKGLQQLVLAIGLSIWVDLARVIRGQVLALRSRQWVQAAQVLGLPPRRIILRHLLPNLTGTIVILSCANFATAILLEAGLSFLGLGVAPPTPTWGSMVQEGFSQILFANGKWLAFFPGLAIVMLILSLNLVAMALRDAADPANET
ncbi:MAG: ABC transporter permease [Bacteroidetes bacterium]|nr:ABC transporter permease [Bacteroidota bacterium]